MSARPSSWLDHFVVAVEDLEAGIVEFEALSGVRPEFGGEHPTLGTHNALVSLGNRQYLEILAPRPGAALSPMFSAAAGHERLTPILWACATEDISGVHQAVTAAGFEADPPTPGSRRTQAGDILEWSMFMLGNGTPSNAPFFIDWAPGTAHPATTAPAGCTLASFAIGSTDQSELESLLAAAGTAGPVAVNAFRTVIELTTPKGSVVLG